MHADGVSVSVIADQLGVTRMAVYNWIWNYAPDGMLLERHARGRRPKLDAAQVKRLRLLVQRSPHSSGIERSGWSAPALIELIEKFFDVRVSAASAQTLRRRLGA